MQKSERKMPSPADLERSERLREILDALCEVNKRIPIIVEGKRDALALRELGLEGEIIALHRGQGLYDFAEEMADKFPRVVLLLDWDEQGERLYKTLSSYLSGHWEEFAPFRGIIKVLCQKEIKDIEGIPRLLQRLERYE